ncbi:MAG: hypothetical protein BJ554DRAFT_7382, partial [Olpidium bornovanus]
MQSAVASFATTSHNTLRCLHAKTCWSSRFPTAPEASLLRSGADTNEFAVTNPRSPVLFRSCRA